MFDEEVNRTSPDGPQHRDADKRLLRWGMVLVFIHTCVMLYGFGSVPIAPVYGDEVIINDPAISLSRGRGLIAPSFAGSSVGIDKLFAHFPPVYIYLQAAIFRLFGVSAYSLRLLTTVMSIAAAAVFVLLVYRLHRWRWVGKRAALLVMCLYTLSAPTIILQRISRMESLIEFLSLVSLLCVLTVIHRNYGAAEAPARTKGTTGLVTLSAVTAGLCLATHPEAISVVLPIALLLMVATRVPLTHKLVSLGLIALVPFGLWLLTYGRKWRTAAHQMFAIAKDKAPDPSIFRYGLSASRNVGSNQHDLMVLFFLVVCVCVMAAVLINSIYLLWAARFREKRPQHETRICGALTVAVPITFAILMFILPATITRYEVIYPIYLAFIAACPPVQPTSGPLRMWLGTAAGGLVVAEVIACVLYFAQYSRPVDSSIKRYDFVLNCLPETERVAASPQLWLAFVKMDRPFTVLYAQVDGLDTWKRESPDPLSRFDTILLTDYIDDDLKMYAPLSKPGRIERDLRIATRHLFVYSRGTWLNSCPAPGAHF
jgi:4-amino-4-deoxy-L-arabinose transferase-like glycosyltransferase